MTIIKFEHDELFRRAMENPNVAREFFDTHLPEEIRAIVDLSTLKIEKESFVEPKLKKSICDILFSVKFNDQEGYIYTLVEHQSKPDYWIAFRLQKYMTNIWDRHLALHPKSKKLPIIYPAVFYNGKESYNAPENLWDLFEKPELCKKIFIDGYKLINLQTIPDAEMRQKLWSGTLEFFMKNSRKPNLLKLWEEIGNNLPQIVKVHNGKDYIEIFLAYTLTHMLEDDMVKVENLLKEKLQEDLGEGIMASFAQKWFNEVAKETGEKARQEGRQEGVEIGLEKSAVGMLKNNIGIQAISKSTGLSIMRINKLMKDNNI